MKVLLFVQSGDTRPKCVWKMPSSWRAVSVVEHIAVAESSRRPFLECEAHFATAAESDCWWLVECMDAEHGRGIISHVVKHGEDAVQSSLGRILASGGRAAA